MTESTDRREEARDNRFRAYPEYKDSGVDWLGQIPAHWQVKKWRYCCHPVSITESRLQTRFLLYFMLSAPFVQLMVDQSMRVAMPKVNRDKLGACPLLAPDPAEQRAIAAFLDRETAQTDALVAKKQRLIDLLHEKRTALIISAVTRGLDPNVAMKDSGVGWLGSSVPGITPIDSTGYRDLY